MCLLDVLHTHSRALKCAHLWSCRDDGRQSSPSVLFTSPAMRPSLQAPPLPLLSSHVATNTQENPPRHTVALWLSEVTSDPADHQSAEDREEL